VDGGCRIQIPGLLKAMPWSRVGGTGTLSEWGDVDRMASRNCLSSLPRDPMTNHSQGLSKEGLCWGGERRAIGLTRKEGC